MRRVILLALVCLFMFSYTNAYAHPPSDIKLEYSPQSRVLSVIITHQVNNPESHFIKEIDVLVNGEEVITHMIGRQDNNSTQFAVYMIPDAKIGDTIAVEAYCSISGKLKSEIRVTE